MSVREGVYQQYLSWCDLQKQQNLRFHEQDQYVERDSHDIFRSILDKGSISHDENFHETSLKLPSFDGQNQQDQTPKAKKFQNKQKPILKAKHHHHLKNCGDKKSDYTKNICAYVTKKIIREFLSSTYDEEVQKICEKIGCNAWQTKMFYSHHLQKITGPRSLEMLIISSESEEINSSSDENWFQKKVFSVFYVWYLRERYLRFLIMEGKMSQKKEYVDYKNNILLRMFSKRDGIYSIAKQMTEREQAF